MTPELFTPAWTPTLTDALINHLWQSTAVVFVAWLLTLSLRPNRARVRYAIWMIASIKFLFPFALLTSLGAHWATHNSAPQISPSLYVMVEEISQPFRQGRISNPSAAMLTSPSHPTHIASTILAALWICGFLAMLVTWVVRWRRAAAMARNARAVADGREFQALRLAEKNAKIKKPIPLVFSPSEFEPGYSESCVQFCFGPSVSQTGSTMPRSKRSCLMRLSTSAVATISAPLFTPSSKHSSGSIPWCDG